MIAAGIENWILADLALCAQLSAYDFGAGPVPAVFSIMPIPTDAHQPCVTLEEKGNTPWGCRDTPGADVQLMATLWGDKDRTAKELRDLAWVLFYRLHHADAVFAGHDNWGVWASPPVESKSDDGFPGYQITVRVLVLQT